MKKRLAILGGLALATVVLAGSPGLVLRPGTIGKGATAKWINQSTDPLVTDHGLYLSKNVPTSDWEAAGADIGRIGGTPVNTLTELGWRVEDGTLNGGSPRWNIYLDNDNDGSWDTVIFLDHNTAGGDDDNFDAAELAAAITAQGGNLGGTISYLQIIVDVEGFVTLDDIVVGVGEDRTVFSGPGKSN